MPALRGSVPFFMQGLSAAQARRIAIAAQGLDRPVDERRIDVRHFRRVLALLGVVQLDSVNVVARSHYLPFFTRLGPYDRDRLDRWAASSGEVFEYWGHQASMLPMTSYPLLRWRMERAKPWRRVSRLAAHRPGFLEDVYAEVERAPVTISELENRGDRSGPWWGYAPGKDALEWLFTTGRVTATRTRNFKRRYDLPRRVIPQQYLQAEPPEEGYAQRALLLKAARAHGVGTAADIADYYRLNVPLARSLLEDLAASGELIPVQVEGWRQPGYMHPSARLPRRVDGIGLISPFDSMVWNRDRLERLFGFRYRIEIYVPAPQRLHGYYVYPLLVGDRFVGRFDLKADRKTGILHVLGAYAEQGGDAAVTVTAAAGRLGALASWLGLSELAVGRRGDLAPKLRTEVG